MTDREATRDEAKTQPERDDSFLGPGGPQGGPGESEPGEPGYDGHVTLGEEGAAAEQGRVPD